MEVRDALVPGNCLTDQVDGHIIAADLVGDHPEKMQAVEMLWVGRKDVSINALGFGQPPGLMQGHRLLEILVEVRMHGGASFRGDFAPGFITESESMNG